MGFFDWLKLLFGTEQFNAHINALKAINEEYKYKIEQQEKIIKELQEIKQNTTIEDDNIRYEREMEAHLQLIDCIREKRDLQEEIIFLKIDIKRLTEKT